MEVKRIVDDSLEVADITISIAYDILFNQIERERAKNALSRLDDIRRGLKRESRLIC